MLKTSDKKEYRMFRDEENLLAETTAHTRRHTTKKPLTMQRYTAARGFKLVPDPAEEKHESIYECAPTEIEGKNFSVAAGEADYMQRIAGDIYFAEETLGMSLYQFQSHVDRHVKEKIKHYLKPETSTKIEVSDDVCPASQSSEWPGSLTSLIDVTQADAADRLKPVEEEFELKKLTMSQSEIEEFELQLRIAKEAFRYLKKQTKEFKRLIEDE